MRKARNTMKVGDRVMLTTFTVDGTPTRSCGEHGTINALHRDGSADIHIDGDQRPSFWPAPDFTPITKDATDAVKRLLDMQLASDAIATLIAELTSLKKDLDKRMAKAMKERQR